MGTRLTRLLVLVPTQAWERVLSSHLIKERVPVLAKLNTFALVGIDAVLVEAEVDNSYASMPKTVIVGLPEMAVRESVHRIERALYNLDYALPDGRTVINLAPLSFRGEKFGAPQSAALSRSLQAAMP